MFEINSQPESLFKYYRFDSLFNKSRLSGEIFLASPLLFNDVFDCNLQINNNTNDKYRKDNKYPENDEKVDNSLKIKLKELGYAENELAAVVDKLRKDDYQTKTEVRHRQLERAGVLCLTPEATSMLMWAHYANNDGFCIEYDTDCLIHNMIIDFINKMDHDLTCLLAEGSGYCQRPQFRNKVSFFKWRSKRRIKRKIKKSHSIFTSHNTIKNLFLADKTCEERLNFLRNIYIKRFEFEQISYKSKLPAVQPDLFFTQNKSNARIKYYTKFKIWNYEKERRVMLSLGGNKLFNVGIECIKSITLGYHIKPNQLFEIISILKTLKFKDDFTLYIINKSENGFEQKALPLEELYEKHNDFSEILENFRK